MRAAAGEAGLPGSRPHRRAADAAPCKAASRPGSGGSSTATPCRCAHSRSARCVWGVGYLTWRIGWSGAGREPGRLRDAARHRDLRPLGARHPGLVLVVAPARGAPAGDAGRKIDVYVCTYDEPFEVVAATLAGCRALTYPHTTYLLDDGRRPEMEELAQIAGAALPDPARQLPRQGRQHQRRPAPHRGRAGADARRRPRADARRARRDGRLLRRRASRPGAEPARLLQPRLGPALRRRPPRAVALLPRRLPRQGPPRRRLLVRLGGAAAARGAARDRRRRHRDDRRGLPHDDPAAAPRLEQPLPRRGPGPGPRPARPRRLPAAARPLGARQPRRLHPARVPAARPRAAARCSASPTSSASPPTWRRRCGCCCWRRWGW